MASPFVMREPEDMQRVPPLPSTGDGDINSTESIPRRFMGVKVLYTFDDQNRANCLARLPNPMSIPTVTVDDGTEVGVIQLKACIQAIVAASPELVAKLGHDYTVYAYDYSEYETPLVGQGMLSWILASASATPNAPAEVSETMVTGRVCRNVLGLFSNGIKETLEVKLKLVPVPTCLQREYVENMERYHSLSRVMPAGTDYKAWAEFLKTNPAIAQLAQQQPQQAIHRPAMAHADASAPMSNRSMHQMEHSPPAQAQLAYGNYATRPASPALSTISFSHYQPERRPMSQASHRSETAPSTQHLAPQQTPAPEQQEECPPKKRARVTRATRPRKTPLGVSNDSLRVTAATAASVRLHRPTATNPACGRAAMDQVPRAPTPRPGDIASNRPRSLTGGANPSLLRHGSIDEGRPFQSAYDSAMFSDQAADSADDERGNSAGETPMDIPSSPPIMPERMASSVPSSPGLPALPYPGDSGFVSDMPLGKDEDSEKDKNKHWEGSDLPTIADTRTRRKPLDRSHYPWTQVTPGPVELLPKSYIPKPKAYPRSRQSAEKLEKVQADATQVGSQQAPEQSKTPEDSGLSHTPEGDPPFQHRNSSAPETQVQYQPQPSTQLAVAPSVEVRNQPKMQDPQGDARLQHVNTAHPGANPDTVPGDRVNEPSVPPSRAGTPTLPAKGARSTKPRGLPRSQTWSAEPMSDAGFPEGNPAQPRSGSGAKRRKLIAEQLQESLAKGIMPAYCNHCGEIETPTWRKAYTRVEVGLPTGIQLSSDGNGIVGVEVMSMEENDGIPRYRVFKNALDKVEKEGGSYQQLNLCNPCGLYLNKKNEMRPRELWAKKPAGGEKPKRKKYPRKKKTKEAGDDIRSDAVIPHSEPSFSAGNGESQSFVDGASEDAPRPPTLQTSTSAPVRSESRTTERAEPTALAALHRAIQSSPGVMIGSKTSPINVEADLTPKSTRRLLFPSPRKPGEFKSLSDRGPSISPFSKSRSAGSEQPTRKSPRRSPRRSPRFSAVEFDKENCPPTASHDDDDLARLFGETPSTKRTPSKRAFTDDLLKTPTPKSRKRVALGEVNVEQLLKTPTRNLLTPGRNPETPLTNRLNAMLSDFLSSPTQAIDFSSFSPFTMTPGQLASQLSSFSGQNDFLSSDLPVPSSPAGCMGFSMFEDSASGNMGLWSGASIFNGSDPLAVEEHQSPQQEQAAAKDKDGNAKAPEITVDFDAVVDGVNGGGNANDGKGEVEKQMKKEEKPAAEGPHSAEQQGAETA
ncbi:uncharacterized protein EI97DRAFT_465070 [Westerdykella ornata]|uniref:Ams2/SPT21 N-terminal domain-containing protein n=1 Tax=Westerdykella ornata TaxID=318751 RepID=A0A6A6JPV1_WESOR|nr:uncharacterized protein EI97DRAFT_465070 [Westerdykella ornata]KAF2278641.1 hypothetical protein EI97DRAFT_465070 [Westerdykella ornata]